jgi:hypothetical protein
VKQSDLGEYEENARESKIYNIQDKAPTPPSSQAIRMANTDSPRPTPQISKARSIEGFGEDIGQLSLCAYVSHLNISLLNVIS